MRAYRSGTVYEKMQKGLFRVLIVFAVFTWLIVFAINMNKYVPVNSRLDPDRSAGIKTL